MEIPLKTRNKSTIRPSNPTTGIHPEKTTILKDIHVPQCSLPQYLQKPGHTSNLNVHGKMNGYRSCGTFIQWIITQYIYIYIYIYIHGS